MVIYPFNYPLILNDDIFTSYGGNTGTSTPSQRTAAYMIAEQKMTDYVGTLLLPHDVTGSVPYNVGMVYTHTDYGYVNQINFARVVDAKGSVVLDLSGTSTYVTVNNDTFGYFQITDAWNYYCGSPYNNYPPYKLEFAYNAGLPSGSASTPAMLSALTMSANIELSEMIGFPTANEGVGDVGIVEYETLDYREKRKMWKNTTFGASAKSAKIANLVDGAVRKARRALFLGR